jgi:sugar/nucleoside kinase (ribokinase family)
MLGLNLREAVQVAAVLGVSAGANPEEEAERLARDIRERLGIFTVVIHPRSSAAACELVSGEPHSCRFAGPFISRPRLSTGAGDVFNAGFCLGRLAGLSLQQCLATATACSGYYVRHAANPTLEELADFLDALPAPEEP